ncbi:MAG: DUF4249 domain-containing protein [Calditrichaeota bacterium]|nr:MAG: DUF4249 domain-containing protein [Calditrichota bacterium]
MFHRIYFQLLSYFFLMLIFLAGCENPADYRFKPKLTVNGELKAGNPIDSIYVSWAVDITDRYDTEDQKVHRADVRINGILLEEYPDLQGAYYYPDTSYRVSNGEKYRIEVRYGEEMVYSETRVPSPLKFNSLGVSQGDTVQYIPGTSWFSEEFFTLVWPESGDSQIFRIISRADSANPTNFIEDDRIEAEVFKGEPEDRLNPGIWWVADNYARINWMYFNWRGWHDIIVSAVDSNYYNYRKGVLFGEQSGQNFNQVVKGGYGLFFSTASDTLRIYLVE